MEFFNTPENDVAGAVLGVMFFPSGPDLRARKKRAEKLDILTEYFVVDGIPAFIGALLKNPQELPKNPQEPPDEAWNMLHKLNRVFAVKDPERRKMKKARGRWRRFVQVMLTR